MEAQPVELNFSTGVRVTVVSAFLSTCGPLLADPCAHVNLVSTPQIPNIGGGGSGGGVNLNNAAAVADARARSEAAVTTTRRMGSTSRRLFAQHPVFNESVKFALPHSTATRRVTVEIEGADGSFLGVAVLPMSLSAPSKEQSKRLMLLPRNASHPDDPLFKADAEVLARNGVDDFGWVLVHWEVQLIPFGGIADPTGASASSPTAARPGSAAAHNPPLPPFPIGCTVKAQWLTSASAGGGMGTMYTTLIDFGNNEFHEVESTAPIFVALHQPSQLRAVNFTCKMQQGLHGEPTSAEVFVPMPRPTEGQMNRDAYWACPVISPRGDDWGVLMVTVRLTPKPMDPAMLLATSGPKRDWGRPDPDCPIGAFLPIQWESNEHVARSTERRWRSACVTDAKPTDQHVRHLLEVVLGRVALDPNVAQLVSAFFNKAPASVSADELRQLLIALAFGAAGLTVREACRFAFIAMRRDAEEAIAAGDVDFILENALLPRTLDMPRNEVTRRVRDIYGSSEFVTWDDFETFFINNYAHWYALGVPIEHGAVTAATAASSRPLTSKTMRAGSSSSAPQSAGGAPPAADAAVAAASADPWRSFAVRFLKTGRAFTVTAHCDDTFDIVAGMLEDSIGLPPSRQQLSLDGRLLEPKQRVGDFIAVNQEREVTIVEKDETVTVHLVHREKNKKWTHKMLAGEKVLKLRAHVQQRTMIPLTRVVLTVADTNTVMWDRHGLDHYRLGDGAIIIVSSSQ